MSIDLLSPSLAPHDPRPSFRRSALPGRGSAPLPVEAFLGESPDAREIARLVPKLAGAPAQVLIEGETGVGKTFLAGALHERSGRAGELHVVDCGAIPESLVESELFGCERGAFTGAHVARAGAFEVAGQGTLLLDEIGELPLASQAKLLRALAEGRFKRLGATRPTELRARVVCATNRDLEAMVAEGTFRRDLLFRIAVFRMRVPPLRERGDDLVALARHLLEAVCREAKVEDVGFAPDALAAIRRHDWPGNVRELRHAIEYAVTVRDGGRVTAKDLPSKVRQEQVAEGSGEEASTFDLAENERRVIRRALAATGGHQGKAAKLLGINRSTLRVKLKGYGREGGQVGAGGPTAG